MATTISGLKYTTGLSLASLEGVTHESLRVLCGQLAGQRIHLAFFISYHASGDGSPASFCFEQTKYGAVSELITRAAREHQLGAPVFHEDVAAITIYPRGRGLGLALGAPAALIAAGQTPLAAGTSLAAVVAVVEGSHLFESLDALQKAFPLPEGVHPTGERIKVVQEPRR